MIESGVAAGDSFFGEGCVLSVEDRGHCFSNIHVRTLLDGSSGLRCTLLFLISAFLPSFRWPGDAASGVEPVFLFDLFIASKAHTDSGAHHGSVKPGSLNLPTA